MIEIDTSRFRHQPYAHQLQGVKDLVTKPLFNLFWEMRTGKTKTIIDAACLLWEANLIDAVVVACPAQVKDVWLQPELGELHTHVFVPYYAMELNADTEEKVATRLRISRDHHVLTFIVASYEFLRQEDAQTNFPKVQVLSSALDSFKWWLVCDEGCALGNWEANQTRALYELRSGADELKKKADRVTVMDGTPLGNSPLTLYTKFKLLDRHILKGPVKLADGQVVNLHFKEFSHYKTYISVTAPGKAGKKSFRKTVGWKNLDKITQVAAPYCSRVEANDVLDMPRMVPGLITATLTEKSWKVYKDLRDQLVTEIDGEVNAIQHAHVKVLRLAQVCGGFLGGFESEINEEKYVKEIGEEALRALLLWMDLRFKERTDFKVVVWVRFRAEIQRLVERLQGEYQDVRIAQLYGDVKDYNNELHPKDPYTGAFILVVQQQAAQYGMNFSKASTEVFASQDYNVVTRSQAEVRLQAPNTRSITSVNDLLVTGPQGQKTVTHDIVRSLREKEDLGRRTAARWKQVLTEE